MKKITIDFKEAIEAGKAIEDFTQFDVVVEDTKVTGDLENITKILEALQLDVTIAESAGDEEIQALVNEACKKKVEEEEEEENMDKGSKEAYQKFFNSVLKKFDVSSPNELDDEKKKEFYDYIEKNWTKDESTIAEMTQKDVEKIFKTDILPDVKGDKKKAWKDFVEMLVASGDVKKDAVSKDLPKQFESVNVIDTIQTRLSEMTEGEINELNDLINDPIMRTIKSVAQKVTQNVVSEEASTASDDIKALIEANEQFTEEFKETATTLFEAAVAEKVEDKLTAIREEYETRIHEEVKANYDRMADKLDAYLTYAIEEWVSENDISISNKLRVDISESFIEQLKNVFEKHYIEMPESKVDLYDDLAEKATQLEETVEKQTAELASLQEQVRQYNVERILAEACEGMYDTEAARLRKLAESLEFKDADQFKKKIGIIKESYFKHGQSELTEQSENKGRQTTVVTTKVEENEESEDNSVMGKYVKAISRQVAK